MLISQNNSRKKNINKIRKKIKIIFLYKVTVVAIKRTTTSTMNTIIITRHNYTRTLPVDEIFEMKFCSYNEKKKKKDTKYNRKYQKKKIYIFVNIGTTIKVFKTSHTVSQFGSQLVFLLLSTYLLLFLFMA